MWRFLAGELPLVVVRLSAALILYALASAIPWPALIGPWITVVAFAGLVISFLVICGKLLYDTFYPLQNQHSRSAFFYPKERR